MTNRLLTSALVALIAGFGLGAPASALDCPATQPVAKPGVLKETSAQIEETGKMLSSGDVGRQTQALIADLRRQHPDADNAEIVNFIITAYCPVIAQTALSETEKKARMDQFVSGLMQKVY